MAKVTWSLTHWWNIPIRNKSRLLWVVLATSFLFTPDATAQYRFDSWTTDNGLPQNTVFAILQTRDGYLWFTTSDGLVRYDGVKFSIFDKGNTPAIKSNRFTALYEDANGDLWFGTEDGFVTRYQHGVFTTFATNCSWPANTVDCIRRDPEGTLWVSTSGGIVRMQNDRFAPFVPEGVNADRVKAYPGQSGALWCFLDGEVSRLENGSVTLYKLPSVLATMSITGVYEASDASLWLAVTGGYLFNLKNGGVTTYQPAEDRQPVKSIFEDRSGVLWLGTDGIGLIKFERGSFTRLTTAEGLPDRVVLTVYEDREGSIWLGTGTHGISRMTRKAITVYSSRDGLVGDSTHAMLQDRSGDIWIGAGGLNRLHGGKWTSYTAKNGLRFYNVTALAEDRDGRLWVGGAGGLSWFRDGKFVEFSDRLGLKVGDYNVWAIHQDHRGTLWFATDKGLAAYENDVVRLFTTNDGLAGDDVKAIREDSEGNLWFGTYGGLSCLKSGRFISITEQDGLSSNRVRSLYEDSDGTMWIGTYDGGLNRLKDGKLARYTTGDGLFNNGVFQILEDDSGNFWMSSNLGIYRANKRELEEFADRKRPSITCVSFGRQDGMLNAECNGGQQPAGMKTRDGRLWFPTQQGVAVIDPRSVPLNQQPPPVVIESCSLDRTPINLNGPVRITPGKESLEIRYAGLSFIKPERVRFKYKLEGLDHDWVDAGTRREAFYSHLPPGSYVFRVIAANSDGVWNTAGQSLEIVVVPPFWRTWWFFSLALTVVIGTAVVAYRVRVSRLEKANALQRAFSRQLIESQESERKRIAAELHDSLGQRLVVIKNLALLGLRQTGESEPIRRNVDEISTEASQAINEVKEISYNLRPYQLDRIGLTKAIEALVNKTRLSTGIDVLADIEDVDGVLSDESEINLYRIIQESLNNIAKHSHATEARVAVEVRDHVLSIGIKDNGKGFAHGTQSSSAGGGFGLIGISERVRMLGGTYSIHSSPGHGTTLAIRIDLEEQPA